MPLHPPRPDGRGWPRYAWHASLASFALLRRQCFSIICAHIYSRFPELVRVFRYNRCAISLPVAVSNMPSRRRLSGGAGASAQLFPGFQKNLLKTMGWHFNIVVFRCAEKFLCKLCWVTFPASPWLVSVSRFSLLA